MSGIVVFWLLAAIAFVGALTVVATRDVMRLVLGLGAFLVSVAGFFLYFKMEFIAIAQVFVYVGGVLVLVLFAIMIVVRDEIGTPALSSRFSLPAASVSVGLFLLLIGTVGPEGPALSAVGWQGGMPELGRELLGTYLPHFEALGVLLLATLVGVLAISGKGESR